MINIKKIINNQIKNKVIIMLKNNTKKDKMQNYYQCK